MAEPAAILCYGAYGYTGQLIVRLAKERGISLVVAGRNAERTQALAERHGFEHRVFGLDEPGALDAGLAGLAGLAGSRAGVVIHCAGPFSRTAAPMVDACLRGGVHYLDITGEAAVFEALSERDDEARRAGVMLLPGAGFDVVPSDCLAGHVAARVQGATHLVMGFSSRGGGISHGTATTIVENIAGGTLVRREGRLVARPMGSITGRVDFGDGRGAVPSAAIAWGDVVTAWVSTSIPNIEVYVPLSVGVARAARVAHSLRWLSGSRPVQARLKRWVDSRPAGPTDEQRARGRSFLFATATNASGDSATSFLKAPEGYTLTADTALLIAERVLKGQAPPGFQTPSTAYGADLILQAEGVERRDG